MEVVEVRPGTRLEQLLKLVGLYSTGGEAKLRIQQGRVLVNGAIEKRRAYQLSHNDIVEAEGKSVKVKIQP